MLYSLTGTLTGTLTGLKEEVGVVTAGLILIHDIVCFLLSQSVSVLGNQSVSKCARKSVSQ